MNRIVVNTDRVVGTVDRRILGGFAEHMGRCIYGGVFDENSPRSDAEGFRTDVLEAVRALRPPVLRWPGGNFVSGYHFHDGIGPIDSRPRRFDAAWRTEESNRFGTDEFMRLCELVGAEPYLCLNMGTGTLDEAREWLEYCNSAGNTEAARQRRANGRDEPYGVRYFGLGNEVYGEWQIGHKTASDYVTAAREWAKVLTWTDPSIELVACGETGWSDWDETVISGLAEFVRYYSIHIYTGSEDYWSNVLAPHQAERAVRITSALIEKARYNQRLSHRIDIAYDEWNVRVAKRHHGPDDHEETYTLADALAVATYVHGFVRNAAVVKMANLAQLVNVLAPIMTSPEGIVLQSIYHPLRLFGAHLEGEALDVAVSCPRHDLAEVLDTAEAHRVADLGPFPVLDVVAWRSSDQKTLWLSVVNRAEEDLTAELALWPSLEVSAASLERVEASDWRATNTFAHPDAVGVVAEPLEGPGGARIQRFPAHTHSVISLALA
ncbi:MAG: alpha-N-arabinofuranosidase [Actinomycetota bacterium]|nr:alpha-N-arabinofuranosidase [Actinomycetota bacterium]